MDWYISNGLIFAYISLFVCFNMKSKINKVLTFLIVFVPFAVYGLSQKILTPYVHPIIHVAVTWLIFFVCSWFAFEEKVKTKIFIILGGVAVNYIGSIIGIVMLYLTTNDIQKFDLLSGILVHTTLIAMFAVFTLLRQKIHISQYNFTAFTVMGITQLIFIEMAIVFLVYGADSEILSIIGMGTEKAFAILVIVVAIGIYIISDIVLFIMMRKLSQVEKTKEELRFREYKNKISLDYYKSMEKNAEETRKLRHDMANLLQIAGSLIDGNADNKETSEQILSQIRKEFSGIHLEKYTENPLVNAIVSNKAVECREKEVEYEFDICLPDKISAEEIDICKAYVNIIDNAINAVSELHQEKFIKIKSYIENGSLYITSTNRYEEDNNSKKNPVKHGYGKKILSEIAEKYNGKFLTEKSGGVHTAIMVMKVDN